MDSILDLFPEIIRKAIFCELYKYKCTIDKVSEIRFRINKPIIFTFIDGTNICEIEIEKNTCVNEFKMIIDRITDYSIYAFEDELRQGFLTIKGGHRIGLAGQTILKDGNVMNLKNISFMNIRMAHQIIGCGRKIIPYIISENGLMDTLIISPPGCGKTTLLRDIVRIISDGENVVFNKGVNVCVVDERSELAGCYLGEPQLNVGKRTDVLDACPKAIGMLMMLRSMNPDVIAVDEIGSREDIDAISYVINCGCKIIATVHGESIDDIRTRPAIRRLVEERIFDRYIVLGKSKGIGTIENIFDERGSALLIKASYGVGLPEFS